MSEINSSGAGVYGTACPACGHCPHCGRGGGYHVAPFVIPQQPWFPQPPWFPQQPWITVTWTTSGTDR